MPPSVSVIIPTFNRVAFLKDAIASVMAQSFTDWELIVVDDGSTDATPIVLQNYIEQDHRIRSIWTSNNGVAKARSLGIEAAKGKYISFLDDDDYYLPGKLESQFKHLEDNPSLMFVYGYAEVVDVKNDYLKMAPRNPAHSFHDLICDSVILPTSVLVRKVVLDEFGGFRAGLKTCEDYDLWLRIAHKYPFAFYPEIVSRYRRHDSNITHNIYQIYSDENRVRQHLLLITRNKTERKMIRESIKRSSTRFFGIASQLAESKNYKEALRFYESALLLNPLVSFQISWMSKRNVLLKLIYPYLSLFYCVLMLFLSQCRLKVARSNV
ncbi:MAG: glycosyltransferase [Candidatus Omnitrophica bacterium]|nr:glycosyltransferase [Candidatus Omnitrophota bacterium]MDD5670473.1 glycosyltransferase [Candidatus Omnitrophota bacterium]